MPKNPKIKKVLVLGSGPIVIGQAAEFDYAGTQACRALREENPDTTKLIIAQRISSVEHADKIIVMDDGRINGFGTPAEMLANNHIYQEVCYSQTKGGEPDAE